MLGVTRFLAFNVIVASAVISIAADSDPVAFDLPPVAVARDAKDTGSQGQISTPIGWRRVVVELNLSCVSRSIDGPSMQQCIVRCKPRDNSIQIVDYAPRTELASDYTTPIQVKRIDETSKSMGLSLNGGYGHIAQGNAGTDLGNKSSESVQFDRAAPLQALISSGTFDRGRGVYFKLRWTPTHLLEGERQFQLTMCVPPNWRGELIDVQVTGEAEQRSMTSWEQELRTVASSEFLVATYPDGDREAESLAFEMAELEYQLRHLARQVQPKSSPSTLPGLLRYVARKIDVDAESHDYRWVNALLFQNADPHVDAQIKKLPADVRVRALDYVATRDRFRALGHEASDHRMAKQ